LREGDAILARPELGLRRAGRRQLSGGPVGNFFAAHFSDATQVVAARIRVARRDVYLFCTHWHASAFPSDTFLAELERQRCFGKLSSREYARQLAAARAGQKWRLREAHKTLAFIERVAGSSPAILMGDFNALPNSDEISLLGKAGFLDAFATVGKGPGFTWDEGQNTNIQFEHRSDSDWAPDESHNKRIDYVFVRGAGLNISRAQVVLDRPIEGLYPSDHFGVLAEITVR
jgi:endonuclease/exonuclease/phosphatase family metal-dependent hydrolase